MRRLLLRLALGLCALLAFGLFLALGSWQLERRSWKLDLIERVEQRVHAAAIDAPGPDQWAAINRADDEYRRVRVHGVFLHAQETLVQASTALGSGYWVLTPLRSADGHLVLVNRGFVTTAQKKPEDRGVKAPEGLVTVTGLLRLNEPHGALLRDNDPGAERWYSRDVHAIAQARRLGQVAPYFIDADATAPTPPQGGLTVIRFANNHLVYALTWYALALMVLAAVVFTWRERQRPRAWRDNDHHDHARD